ncbi:MAG: hypothetical protein WA741_34395 [Candidatus Sulfotelmatobacter sp.]
MRAGDRIPLLAGELSGNRCAIGHAKSDRFLLLFRARQAVQQADASVPSQNHVSVTLWANAQIMWRRSLIYRVELKPRTVLRGVIEVIASTYLVA